MRNGVSPSRNSAPAGDGTRAPESLPATLSLDAEEVTLRLMTAADTEAVLAFAHRQPAADLVFLRRDITDPAQVDAWIGEIERGHVTTVLALQPDGSLRGYAILDRGALRWMRHVAEIRVLVDAAARRQGLGHILLQVAFEQALASGARKIVAQMTTAQSRALALFESLGFELEATLHNHVIDSQDRTYDLLLLSFNTERQGLQPCDSCGRSVLSRLPLEGDQLCWSCYELRYLDIGVGG